MKSQVKSYIDNLFVGAPLCRESVDLRDEILQNCLMRYEDAVALGKSESDAYNEAISSIGDVRPLIEEIAAKEECGATRCAYEAVLDTKVTQGYVKKKREDDDEDEEKQQPFAKRIGKRIIWGTVVPLYVIISFLSGAWGVTWLLFICAVLAENILDVAVDIEYERRAKNEEQDN